MIGPPAIPNLTGVLIPGNVIGNAPNSIPSDIPMKTAKRFGLFNRLISSPKIFPTVFTEFASPTIVNRSPICRRRSGEGQQVYTGHGSHA